MSLAEAEREYERAKLKYNFLVGSWNQAKYEGCAPLNCDDYNSEISAIQQARNDAKAALDRLTAIKKEAEAEQAKAPQPHKS